MKKLIMTTAALALFASDPAFAGCGSHGGGGFGGAYRAPAYSAPKYSTARTAVAARPAPAKSQVKVAALQTSIPSDGGGSTGEPEAKSQPIAAAASSGTVPVKSAETAVKQEVETAKPLVEQQSCKKYSPTLGGMITVPCE